MLYIPNRPSSAVRGLLGRALQLQCRNIHSGGATTEGTRLYAEQFPNVSYSEVPKKGWKTSTMGFGGYRIKKGVEEHEKALALALRSGINVIDTSGHFENGASEELIGKVVGDSIRSGVISREALVLITKAGYISGPRQSRAYDVAEISENVSHSIHPNHLESEITQSLQRLSMDKIDIFMLNNPERMLLDSRKYSAAHVYEQIAVAAAHLDKEVERGRIGGYGVCSNSIAVQTAPDRLDFTQLWQTLPKRGVNLSNFLAIEYPFNLFERDADTPGFDGAQPLMSLAVDKNLFQLTQRPLMAIAGGQIRLLSTTLGVEADSEPQIMQDLTDAFENISTLEMALPELLSATESDMVLVSQFIWGQALADNMQRLIQNSFAARYYLDRQIKPALKSNLQQLRETAKEMDNQELMLEWANQYERDFDLLASSFLKLCNVSLLRANQDLQKVLSTYAPKQIRGSDPFSVTSVLVARSALAESASTTESEAQPAGCVLVGMRTPAYVEQMATSATTETGLLNADQLDRLYTCPSIN
ncbi:NADP-dependent oxidoreductase domain-containing protein [Phlyctochytrium arcticum]|nr:NADP-dependent oxidoreductase domain-containing protein [Phlyctochytrium arcticum]